MEARLFPSITNRSGFASTCWETVRACAGHDQAAQAAREALCRDYWYPLYAYIKRKGHQEHDAEDLTQAFFADILHRPWFARADPGKGKFRSFLLASVDNFLHLVFKQKKALKRGGAYDHIPLDMAHAESRYHLSAAASISPAEVYEFEWATALVTVAIQRLEEEHAAAGKLAHYQHLKTYLTTQGDVTAYEATASALGVSAANIKVAVHRLRKRYGAILRAEVARTVKNPADVDGEIRHMRDILAEA